MYVDICVCTLILDIYLYNYKYTFFDTHFKYIILNDRIIITIIRRRVSFNIDGVLNIG